MYNIVHVSILIEDFYIRYPILDIYILGILCICSFASIYRERLSQDLKNANDNFYRGKLLGAGERQA